MAVVRHARAALWALWVAVARAVGPLLEPFLRDARDRMPAVGALCQEDSGYGPNFFVTRMMHTESGLNGLEFAVIESVLFNHPLARIFVFAYALDQALFDGYLREGYCVLAVPLQIAWMQEAVQSLEPELGSGRFVSMSTDRRAVPFLLNCALLAVQLSYGGVTLAMDGLLLNPFDFMLPAPLSLHNTAVFLERALGPDEPVPPETLEAEDFERSWAPRSHTDRAEGRTTLCGEHLCPRAMPKDCTLGRQLLHAWLADFVHGGEVPSPDVAATRLYKAYVRSRPLPSGHAGGASVGACEALPLPGWSIVEPHFPDGWRYYGDRGGEEAEDRPHFHSQLFAPRAHRERPDWWLVRSLKLWLPLDYGPSSARNVLPRSAVDLARRLLALRLAPAPPGPLLFGAPSAPAGASGGGGGASHSWRAPADAFSALDNSMAESLGVGEPMALPKEAALPGVMGGFRTFRDVRIIGRGGCPSGSAPRVRARVRTGRAAAELFCRRGPRPEAEAMGEAPDALWDAAARRACSTGLSASGFELSGPPARVNAALALLAYRPVAGLGRAPLEGGQAGPLEQRLTGAELDAHFTTLGLELSESCADQAGAAVAGSSGEERQAAVVEMQALLDDVEDQVTVVAHSALRCDLLERLGISFRQLYRRLPVVVTCECPDPELQADSCTEPVPRSHPSIPHMTVVDVPYDFGLSRGKRLLVQLARTEFVLVLDDDFVRSPLSCVECMLWHMRSRLHSLTLPFDLLGFPILEDERNFGAFRGQLRATSGRLFLEPMMDEPAVDGCTRVGIHPMAFLARTSRLRGFRFEDQLRVGEHEQFFFANRYLGLHAAVCFDSTFPHFRVRSTDGYKMRRERMQALMTKEFEKIGFPSVLYLLHKHDALSGVDHAEFISNDVPPWQISDDSCGPTPDPPTDFAMFFAAVLSTADSQGAEFRAMLRGGAGNSVAHASVWLQRLNAIASARWAFFVPGDGLPTPGLAREDEEFGDLVFMPARADAAAGQQLGTSASQLHFVLSFLKDFQFRWLIVAEQDAFVHVERLVGAFIELDPPIRTVLGGFVRLADPVRGQGEPSLWLPQQFFAVTRDVFSLLASSKVAPWLRTDFPTPGAALNAWLAPLAVRQVELPGVVVDRREGECPAEAAVLHPVTPGELLVLSEAALKGFPCAVLNATG